MSAVQRYDDGLKCEGIENSEERKDLRKVLNTVEVEDVEEATHINLEDGGQARFGFSGMASQDMHNFLWRSISHHS